jgi:hypothetical protein
VPDRPVDVLSDGFAVFSGVLSEAPMHRQIGDRPVSERTRRAGAHRVTERTRDVEWRRRPGQLGSGQRTGRRAAAGVEQVDDFAILRRWLRAARRSRSTAATGSIRS